MASVRMSRVRDVTLLAERLRAADRQEIEALGLTPFQSLMDGFVLSLPPHTIADEQDEPLGMFGAVPMGDRAAIWMWGSDALVEGRMKWEFLSRCRSVVDGLLIRHQHLVNIVGASNTLHRRWLEWCGFTFGNEHIVNGHKFIAFERRLHV